jgi:hypothetical protein
LRIPNSTTVSDFYVTKKRKIVPSIVRDEVIILLVIQQQTKL